MAKAICFVVSLLFNGERFYYVREGYFLPDLLDAAKWTSREGAERIATLYKGAQVETIKTGEVLK